jgi:CheY-like chemotaxis protein
MSCNEPNILIVDDDPVVLKSLKDLLALRGVDTDIAIGGREAIACLDQREYDLVLLDLQMPYCGQWRNLFRSRQGRVFTRRLFLPVQALCH